MAGTITAYVGGNGDGKTLGAVAHHATPAIKKGRPIWATFRILDPTTGEQAKNTHVITSWRDLLDLHDCLLILDEINSEFPSRGAMSLPPELLRLIHQLRKPRVDVVWTAVNWARADVALREATRNVTVAQSYLPDKWEREHGIAPLNHPSGRTIRDLQGHRVQLNDEWPPNRLFRYRTYDATAFSDFTVHAMETIKPLKTRWYWRPWHDDQYRYDTTEQVPLMDHVDQTGTCVICGGKKTQKPCTCGTANGTARRRTPARAVPVTPLTTGDQQ